jgi:hypothetical protein
VREDIRSRVVGDENTDNQTFMNDVHPDIRFQVTFKYADNQNMTYILKYDEYDRDQ